ncbi:MAG: DUF4149 domain-containing protein [Vampirovibrio sp.]|nr:DUF4149 domain-containing protein [Vampirovibrio sp.]
MSNTLLFPTGTAVQGVGLALIIGGTLALGAFTAPVLFKQFARPDAGQAMTMIFRRYDMVLTVAMLLVIAGEGLRLFSAGLSGFGIVDYIRIAVVLALVGMMCFSLFNVNPKMEAMVKSGQGLQQVEQPVATAETEQSYTTEPAVEATVPDTNSTYFRETHELSEKLSKLALAAALLALIMTPFATATPQQPENIQAEYSY